MSFTSTHKDALKSAMRAWLPTAPDEIVERGEHLLAAEAAIRSYLEARGAKIVSANPTLSMLREISLVEGFFDRALEARYRAMLSASPDPFTDEVRA